MRTDKLPQGSHPRSPFEDLSWLAVAGLIVGLDQLTKVRVTTLLNGGAYFEVTSFFNIVLAYNKGAAFGFLSTEPGWQRYFFTALAGVTAIFITGMLRKGMPKIRSFALSLILAGAVGNAIDRVLYGHVIDFLDFHLVGVHFPAFNVADIGICAGVALIAIHELLHTGRSDEGQAAA